MRVRFCCICLVILLGVTANAQSRDTPAVEIYGGYANLSENSMHGWNASVAINANPWFAVVADFGGHRKNRRTDVIFGSVESKSRINTFLFGPRISLRKNQAVTPFAHLLVGVARSKASANIAGIPFPDVAFSDTQNSFALAAGGGLDVRLNDRFALRLMQIEYLQTRFSEARFLDQRQHQARVSGGLIIKF
jgi:opacity protein-like surface antigen